MRKTLCLLMVTAAFGGLWAQSPQAWVQMVNEANSPLTEKVTFRMTLTDDAGNSTVRTGTQYFKRKSPGQTDSLRLYRFHSPAEMAKSAVLIVENTGKDNDQWIYLPATYSTRKIPARNRGDRYMGTDFSYEDAVNADLTQYQFQDLGSDAVEGVACQSIEQIPIHPKLKEESLYSRQVSWVDQKKKVLVKREYYDKSGALLKVYRASSFETSGDHYRAGHVEIEDLKIHHKTVIDYAVRDTSTVIKDAYFTVRSLERPE